MINRTTITIRTRQRTVLRSLADVPLVGCSECHAEVIAVTAECAAGILQFSLAAISELIAAGLLHATAPGAELICCQSLLNFSIGKDDKDLGENR